MLGSLKRESSENVWSNRCFKGVHQNCLLNLKIKDTAIKRISRPRDLQEIFISNYFFKKVESFNIVKCYKEVKRADIDWSAHCNGQLEKNLLVMFMRVNSLGRKSQIASVFAKE